MIKDVDKKVERDLIVDQIYNVLREQILTGKWEPDTRLIENQIAEHFQVSRSPVREALAKLEHMGLVYRDKQFRYVQAITEDSIVEQYHLWQMIEGYGARLACMNANQNDINQLENIFNKMEPSINTLSIYRELNLEFHEQLVRPCPYKKIIELHKQVLTHNRWVMNFTLKHEMEPKTSIADHKNILELFRKKQPDDLENQIRSHVAAALERIRINFHQYFCN